MWLENLKKLKKEKNMSCRQLAEKTNLPEKTIIRVFSGETENPTITTIIPIITALGGSFNEIFADTQAIIGSDNLSTIQNNLDTIKIEKDLLVAEKDILAAKLEAVSKELELVKNELMFNKKLLAVHEYYTNLKTE